MPLPIPCIYDPKRTAEVYVERAALVADAAEEYAKTNHIKPSMQDEARLCVFGIDCQIGFCTPGASLFVPGAVEDTDRAIRFIYRNLDKISALHFSMDTHRIFQIFHPAWWVDASGKHPAPFTPITSDDVKTGRWMPILHPGEALEYTQRLVEDAMSPLPPLPIHPLPPALDFPAIADRSIAELARAGMSVVKTTDPVVF
jgi:hypothetical protein